MVIGNWKAVKRDSFPDLFDNFQFIIFNFQKAKQKARHHRKVYEFVSIIGCKIGDGNRQLENC